MPCVYVLQSLKTKRFYTGSSHEDSSGDRLVAHNAGKVRSTKFGRPWVLKREEFYASYTEARKRELFLKSRQGRKFIMETCRSG